MKKMTITVKPWVLAVAAFLLGASITGLAFFLLREQTPDDQRTVQASPPATPEIVRTLTPVPAPTAIPCSNELAAARVRPSVVRVQTIDGMGTGFIVDPTGLVITAAHVVDA